MIFKASRWAACGSFVAAALVAFGAAAAPEARAVADALVAVFAATGKATATYDDASASGETITIAGFRAVQPDRKGRDLTVATIVIDGVAERQPGGFSATQMTFRDGSASYRGNRVAWQIATVEDAIIPTAEEVRSLSDSYRPFASATVRDITVSGRELAEPVNVDQVNIAMGADAAGEPNSFTLTTTGIALPASAFDAPELRGMLQGLGYTDLVVAAQIDAGFDAAADTFTLRSFMVDVADVGKLMVSGKFSGVKVHDMMDGPRTMAAPDEAPAIDALTIRIDNAGVVERALDMQAELLGTDRKGVAAQWPMLLMFLMGDAGGRAFQDKLMAALAEFLESPKSLTLTLAPPAPVPLDKVAQTLEEDQTKLPDLLAVNITANN